MLRRGENAVQKPMAGHPEDNLPAWSGDRQRAHLKGFARLKAILWRRSLQLYQGWKLADQPWYPPLVRALKQTTGRLDLFAPERVKRAADVFGETPILTTVSLLRLTEDKLGRPPALFVDLGCGRGVSCLTAASLGITAQGYEQEPAWVQAARKTAAELGLPAAFEEGDFLQAEWPGQALYFIVGTAYPAEMREEIALRLSELGPEVAVITGDWSLPDEVFEPLWRGSLPVDWGIADFTLWKRSCQGSPEPAQISRQ